MAEHLQALTRNGYLTRSAGKARGIRLTIPGEAAETVSPAQAKQILVAPAHTPDEPETSADLVARLARTLVWMSSRRTASRTQ